MLPGLRQCAEKDLVVTQHVVAYLVGDRERRLPRQRQKQRARVPVIAGEGEGAYQLAREGVADRYTRAGQRGEAFAVVLAGDHLHRLPRG